jgi:hypothetical protein
MSVRRTQENVTSTDQRLLLLAVICGVPTMLSAIHLWVRGDASLRKRIAWTPVLLLPLVGPLLHGALFYRLSPHDSLHRPQAGQGGMTAPIEVLPHDDSHT